MAEFDITYRCNCRCRMCQRWDDPRPESMTVADYQRLAVELRQMAVHQISVAGGEPLVRGQVFEIINAFASAGLSVNLCTNGLLVEKYAAQIIDSGATCVTISLDGASAERHDAIRGISGAYDLTVAGIHRLLAMRSGWRPIVRVRMTVSNLNQREIRPFIQKWQGKADDILLQPVHHCGDAYYVGMQPADLSLDPEVLEEQLRHTPLAGDRYMGNFIDSLRRNEAYPYFRCFAGVLMARIDPWGDLYPCLEQHVKIGSIKKHSFGALWHSKAFDRERERLRNRRTCRCWYNNTALIGHFGRWLAQTDLRRSNRTVRAVDSPETAQHPCCMPLKPMK